MNVQSLATGTLGRKIGLLLFMPTSMLHEGLQKRKIARHLKLQC